MSVGLSIIVLLVSITSMFLLLFIMFGIEKFKTEFYAERQRIYENENKIINELNYLKELINYLNVSLIYKENDLKSLYNYYNELKNKIKNVENGYNELKNRIDALENKISSSNYIVLNPTLEDVKKFLIEDDTDKIPYNNQTFICTDFANRFVSNFLKRGYYACVSILYFKESAHAIVAINTSDHGLIYVEPQMDKIIFNLAKGMNYCEAIESDCNYIIERIIDCFNYGK